MSKTAKTNKIDLIQAIQDLLLTNTVGTQEEICQALEIRGFHVNQVKVSRLLHKLGAIKINEGQRIVYRLPAELKSVTPHNSLNQLVLGITHNETLIVINTMPGSAQLVARLLDQQKLQLDILGTVAGDDTVFIAPLSQKKMREVLQKISRILLD